MYQNTAITGRDMLFLVNGLGWTLGIFVLTQAVGTVIGFALALARKARIPVLAQFGIGYVELFRNSPLLVQLFLVYFGVPRLLAIQFSPMQAGLITLSVNTGAFMTVIVLSALDEVPRGQWEAARAYGLRYGTMLRHVVLPQAMRAVIPPAASLAVGQLQVSALVSVIGVFELTRAGTILNLRTLQPFAVWPLVALGYFAISKPLSLLADRAEARLRRRPA